MAEVYKDIPFMEGKQAGKPLTIQEVSVNMAADLGFLGGKPALFLEAFTGIELSQLVEMDEAQREKVFLGLVKQLELASSLHANGAQAKLKQSLTSFFNSEAVDIGVLTAQVNSLLVYGEKKDITGLEAVGLHNELSHFWRILGWEELTNLSVKSKHIPGTIEDVEESCGNLIRTLALLSEYWQESNDGPKLVVPKGETKAVLEATPVYAVVKHGGFPNAVAVLSYRNDGFPPVGSNGDFKEKALLLERLLSKYPAEFAFLIFEYYSFVKGLDVNGYNLAVLQEYVIDGERGVKGLLNGRFAVLLAQNSETGVYHQSLVANSLSQTALGAAKTAPIAVFDQTTTDNDLVFITHGKLADAISKFEPILESLKGRKGQLLINLQKLSKAIGASSEKKPIIPVSLGKAEEHQVVEINEDMIWGALGEVVSWIRGKGIKEVSIEAGHIHADRRPGKLQRDGIKVGACFAHQLKEIGLDVIEQPMVDEDHVLNTLNYVEYLNLMNSMGYKTQELIFESSPVIREIAIAAILTLGEKFPDNFSFQGNALIFNIPGTDLLVELVRDTTVEPFELGCVIFDVALSLYRVYPELGNLYSSQGGKEVHEDMLTAYTEISDPQAREAYAKAAFPYKTTRWDKVGLFSQGLPLLPAKKMAICNVLEGFYLPQQKKLMGILKSLGIDLNIVSVALTDQGLAVNIMEQ